jgi:hypothetical protein
VNKEQVEAFADAVAALIDGKITPARKPAEKARGNGAAQPQEHNERAYRYCRAALENARVGLAKEPPGRRNNALNIAALGLGHLHHYGAYTEAEAYAALEGACATNGLLKADGMKAVQDTFDSGWSKGTAEPKELGPEERSNGRDRRQKGDGAAAYRDAVGLDNRFGLDDADARKWHQEPLEPIESLVGDMVPIGDVTLLVSGGGGGKTTLTEQLCSVVAADMGAFLGMGCMSGAAYLMATEDRRRTAKARQRKIDRDLFGDREPDYKFALYVKALAGEDVFLWDEEGETELMAKLEEMLASIPDLRLAVIDGASTVFGGNEIRRIEVTRFVRRLSKIADRLNIAIILICHTSKSSDGTPERLASGSTAWVNAARSAILLTRQSDGEPPSITLVKSNITEPGRKIELAWHDGLLALPSSDWLQQRAVARDLGEIIIALVRAKYTPEEPYLTSSAGGAARNIVTAVLDRNKRFKRRDVEATVAELLRMGLLIQNTKRSRTRPVGLYVAEDEPPKTPPADDEAGA